MTIDGSPLEEGDRVDHNIFGFGTVNGAPTATVGPDMSRHGAIRHAGWSILVRRRYRQFAELQRAWASAPVVARRRASVAPNGIAGH